jgi:hypothetical protein
MVDFVFTTGTDVVTITGSPTYSTSFEIKRLFQSTTRTIDGGIVTYDGSGIDIVEGNLYLKAVSYSHGEALRTWIRTKIVYSKNTFSITVPNEVDLGMGKGINLSNVTFPKKGDSGVFSFTPPNNYKINFPFTYRR